MASPESGIRVLLVEDSKSVRALMRAVLEAAPGITVVGEAADGADAVAKVLLLKPDLVTMDLELPVMGGLEAIEQIMARHPVPILVVTAQTGVRTAFAATSLGALDVMAKPAAGFDLGEALVGKIRYLAKVDMAAHLKARGSRVQAPSPGAPCGKGHAKPAVLAIAASTGGPHAIYGILSRLPASFPLPIVLTQHMAQGFTEGMVEWLDGGTPLTVTLGESGARLCPGRVYINPAERAMRVTAQRIIVLGEREPGQIYRPCCNTLLGSVAASYRSEAAGLILTGMGDDGVAGMQAIAKVGGITLAQDEQSSVVYGMNRVAIERGCIGKVLALTDIAAELQQLVGGRP